MVGFGNFAGLANMFFKIHLCKKSLVKNIHCNNLECLFICLSLIRTNIAWRDVRRSTSPRDFPGMQFRKNMFKNWKETFCAKICLKKMFEGHTLHRKYFGRTHCQGVIVEGGIFGGNRSHDNHWQKTTIEIYHIYVLLILLALFVIRATHHNTLHAMIKHELLSKKVSKWKFRVEYPTFTISTFSLTLISSTSNISQLNISHT